MNESYSHDSRWIIQADQLVRKVFILCLCIALFIMALDYFLNFHPRIQSKTLRHIFNVAREQSLGSWYSILLTFLSGLTLGLIFLIKKKSHESRLGWLLLSLFFIYLSADDSAKIHERLGRRITPGLENWLPDPLWNLVLEATEKFPSYPWHLTIAPFLGLAALAMIGFLWKKLESRRLQRRLVLAFLCLTGAVGIDFLEGIEGLFDNLAETLEVDNYTVSHPILMLEEFLEMLGMIFFWTLFLDTFLQLLEQYPLKISSSYQDY